MDRTYTITKENRVPNSPFYMEGTDQRFDFTPEFQIPLETDTFDDKGNLKRIRFIASCDTIIKEEQLARGWPEKYRHTDDERRMLTFLAGLLYVPGDFKNLVNYVESALWYRTEEEKKNPAKARRRPTGIRILYERYDQAAIDSEVLEMEMLITEARSYILKATKEDLINLHRMSKPGGTISHSIDIKTLRLSLLSLAGENPEKVLKGMKGPEAQMTVLVSKAADYGILNLDTLNKAFLVKDGKPTLMANIHDVGGREAKLKRVEDFLAKDNNKAFLEEIKSLVAAHEKPVPAGA